MGGFQLLVEDSNDGHYDSDIMAVIIQKLNPD